MPNRAGAGLIPAHAGKTVSTTVCSKSGRAHPRSRGENGSRVRPLPCVPGSSPLTRGKRVGRSTRHRVDGLIPAHAGKTPHHDPHAHHRRAHPRSRGENSAPASAMLTAAGSSPLTRGKHDGSRPIATLTGLIPAHAGKTHTQAAHLHPHRAHPRSRGENFCGCSAPDADWGSSPLTRGKRRSRQLSRSRSGLIPAHAGKT